MRTIFLYFLLAYAPLGVIAQVGRSPSVAIDEVRKMPADEKKVQGVLDLLEQKYFYKFAELENLIEEAELIAHELQRPDLQANLLIAKSAANIREGNNQSALKSLRKAEQIIPLLNDTLQYNLKTDLAVLYSRAGTENKGREYLIQANTKSRGQPEFVNNLVRNLIKLSEAYIILEDFQGLDASLTEALELASGNHEFLKSTKLAFARELYANNENKRSADLLKDIDSDVSNEENINILSLLIINSIKLDRIGDAEKYYSRLGLLVRPGRISLAPEYWLATGMYLDTKNQYLRASVAYGKLKEEFKRGQNDDVYLEGVVRLATLYSKEFKRDSADYLFQLLSKRFSGNAKDQRVGLIYLSALKQHKDRIEKNSLLLAKMGEAMSTKDSVYRKELADATRELEYRYKILEGKQELKLVSQQRTLDALTYSRNQQRFLLIILGLSLLVVSATALSYVFFQRKRVASRLHSAELQRMQQAHRMDVMRVMAEGEEAERRRIADQLHDEVGSMLSVVRLNLSSSKDRSNSPHNISQEHLNTANRILADVAGTIREMSHHLMPIAIRQYGLKNAIEQLISDINNSGKLLIEHIIVGIDEPDYPEDFQINLYRIIQELFQNIIKHSEAENAIFQLVEHPDSLNLYIEDNGKGINVENYDQQGKGMHLLSSRIQYYDGKITVEGTPGKGTIIIIDIPLPQATNTVFFESKSDQMESPIRI